MSDGVLLFIAAACFYAVGYIWGWVDAKEDQ